MHRLRFPIRREELRCWGSSLHLIRWQGGNYNGFVGIRVLKLFILLSLCICWVSILYLGSALSPLFAVTYLFLVTKDAARLSQAELQRV